jgi:hypothetical protein
MSINKIAALLLFTVSQAGQVFAQEPIATLTRDLDQYRSRHLQEKMFVHTDKECYLAGEICWFKIYVVDAGLHRPLDLSKVAYLEWLDKDNRPVLQAKVGLSKGHGDGSVYLPLTVHSGNYKLRAYTSWMKNFDVNGFFEKGITVVNARKSAAMPSAVALQYKVSFFPEGGDLVENIPSKVAFKITDQYGQSTDCTGVITEDDQDTVARFRTQRFGAGTFILNPRPGHRYRATARLTDGTAVSNLLPSAYKEGTVMDVSPEEGTDHLRVDVRSTVSGSEIYLIADTRQSVKLAMAATLKEGKAFFLINKDSLGEGISHLTIFDFKRQPVCERLVFKAPSHRLQVGVSADREKYATRKKINLQVSSADGKGAPLPADCSLSVFRVDSLQTAPSGHIGNYLWLASDLKGKIESPDYYFDHPEDREAIDNLLLTHGWRRFRWDETLSGKSPSFEFPPEYNGSIISGKVVDGKTGNPTTLNIQGYLSVPGTRTQFTSALCDEGGRIRFELGDFYGAQEIIVQTNPNEDSLYRIDIANPFSEKYTDIPLPAFTFPRIDSGELVDKSVATQVLNRYAGEKLKRLMLPSGVDTSTFYYKADHSYLLDDYTRFTTMEEVMREYVVLMLVQRKGSHYHLPLFDLPNNSFFESDPLILLDGVPVFNMDSLVALDPLRIRKLETVQHRYFLGGVNFSGIMNWTTYKGDLGGYILDPHATVVDYEGLQLQREFYSPSYATDEQAASHLPDFRNVLYWAPQLVTDARGKGELSFYSSDIPGKYLVVVEGLAKDGTAGSSLAAFEVE